jgi:hypothetical protein
MNSLGLVDRDPVRPSSWVLNALSCWHTELSLGFQMSLAFCQFL